MFAKINPNFVIVGAILLVAFAVYSIAKQASAPRETINMEQLVAPPNLPEKSAVAAPAGAKPEAPESKAKLP